MKKYEEVSSVSASGWLKKQMFIIVMTAMMMMMTTTASSQAALICPESSSNCSTKGDDGHYVYHMTCSDFGVQTMLPDACQYSLIVRELTLEPETSDIRTIQARAFDGLRVKKLVLSGLGIEAVNESAFDWLAGDLQELSLDGNQLTALPDSVFSPLSGLKILQLQNNRLTTIGRHLLDGLASLTVLDLSGNQISYVHLEAWAPVPKLSTLKLHNNVMDGILNSTRLGGLDQLEELRLDGNWISEVTPDAFGLLQNLRRLNIARNRIPALPGSAFSANTLLEDVDASENEIGGLEADVFNETKRLTTLLLHGNRINTLPAYVFKHMYNLRMLNLQRNSISGILSNSLSGLSSLRHLDLSQNRIRSLPLGIFDPLGLVETMSLASNQIAVVERRPFESMRNLVTLELSNNQLGSMDDDWFRTTSKLTDLHLDGNRLNTIHPEALSSVQSLREIHLNRNLLSSVDGGLFRNCLSLNYLDLSSNPLRRIHDAGTTFAGLTSLRRMNMSATCLTELSFGNDSAASSLSDLEELDLSANTLYNLSSAAFAGFPGLRRLYLSANDIDTLDNFTFSTLSRLELLDLSGNALVSDDQLSAMLSVLPPSTVVDLSWNLLTNVDWLSLPSAGVYLVGNPLRCDCNSSSWLGADFSRLLAIERTVCLDTQSGRPEVVVCHCSSNKIVPLAPALVESGCTAPDDALSYLSVPRRRPAVVCPWDSPPAVRAISVDVISTTSVRVSWNLTSASDVTITVVSEAEQKNASGEVYEISANASDYMISNLTSGGSYDICVTTFGGDRACAVVVLPVEQTTTMPPLRLRISATSTASTLHVTWDVATAGRAEIVHFRLTWLENGTSNDVVTVWMDRSNTSCTISGLRASTVYRVCVQAIGEAGRTISNETYCDYFSTQAATDTDDVLFIIIVAASAGAFLLILLIIIIVICCCCCCRRRHDDASAKPNITVRPAESTRSVNRGSLSEHSVVSMSVYDSLP